MCLIGRHDDHPAEGTGERRLVDDGDAVVVAGNDRIVVRVRAFDQAGEDGGQRRAEAEVVIAPCDLQVFLGGAEERALPRREKGV